MLTGHPITIGRGIIVNRDPRALKVVSQRLCLVTCRPLRSTGARGPTFAFKVPIHYANTVRQYLIDGLIPEGRNIDQQKT
jgi:hypothetical protein